MGLIAWRATKAELHQTRKFNEYYKISCWHQSIL